MCEVLGVIQNFYNFFEKILCGRFYSVSPHTSPPPTLNKGCTPYATEFDFLRVQNNKSILFIQRKKPSHLPSHQLTHFACALALYSMFIEDFHPQPCIYYPTHKLYYIKPFQPFTIQKEYNSRLVLASTILIIPVQLQEKLEIMH